MITRRGFLQSTIAAFAGSVLARMPIAGAKPDVSNPKIIGIEHSGYFETLAARRLVAGSQIEVGECVYQSGGFCYPLYRDNVNERAVGIALESGDPGQFFQGIVVATSGVVHFTSPQELLQERGSRGKS
jgi:hypothetical protein